MKFTTLIILIIVSFINFPQEASAGVSARDAVTVANNWITLIQQYEGAWGESHKAFVSDAQELKWKGKKIGYFCRVEPNGFIIVSSHRALAPIKAYSVETFLDHTSDQGLAGLLRTKIDRSIQAIENRVGPLDKATTRAIEDVIKVPYRLAWEELTGLEKAVTNESYSSALVLDNYIGGEVLLSSSWAQGAPYNRLTPAGDTCTHTWVGCVATAGAQIMRHWNWPPYGEGAPFDDAYDWVNMEDTVTSLSPPAEIDAVAELSFEYGLAVDMDYGCDESSAYVTNIILTDMEDAFEDHFRYTDSIDPVNRAVFDSSEEWFDFLKGQLNMNQPLPYRVESHAIVLDGWQEIGDFKFIHLNYGWNKIGTCQDGCNTWYGIDNVHLGGGSFELVQKNVRPRQSLGSSLSGDYLREYFPFRYFNVDAEGDFVTFSPGQYLQFLPNVRVLSTGSIQFNGYFPVESKLFTRGDLTRGIKISNGALVLKNGGSIKLY